MTMPRDKGQVQTSSSPAASVEQTLCQLPYIVSVTKEMLKRECLSFPQLQEEGNENEPEGFILSLRNHIAFPCAEQSFTLPTHPHLLST